MNGTANGIFEPIQNNLSLPLPVQTPRQQKKDSENSESSWKSLRSGQRVSTTDTNRKINVAEIQMQGLPCELNEHSLQSLDHMRSIQNLHIQQRQNRLQNGELHQNPNVHTQQPNLIMFTPPRQHEVQEAIGTQSIPKKQRSPKRSKRSE